MNQSNSRPTTVARPGDPSSGWFAAGSTERAGAMLHEMSSWECLDKIERTPLGRICISESGYPVALPINFRLLSGLPRCRVVIRTSPDTAIGRYHGLASLQVDSMELDSGRAWSVSLRGDLLPLLGVPEDADPHPFIATGRTRWMVLNVAAITGRRFESNPLTDDVVGDWRRY